MYQWRILVWVVLAALLPGCGASSDTLPVERVRGFVAAAEAKDVDQMVTFLRPAERRDAAYQLRQVMPRVQTLRYHNPTYELQDNDGTTAHVRVTGEIRAQTTDGQQLSHAVNQVLTLVKEEGQWYISSSEVQLPAPLAR